MPKKFDPAAKAKNAIAENSQAYQRMNFLHQAAILLASMPNEECPAADSTMIQQIDQASASKNKSTTIDRDHEPALNPLSRYYCNTMKHIGKKLVLRLDPNVKRSICKKCENVLIPSITSEVRVKSRPHKSIVTTCRSCKTRKRLVSKKGHELWNTKALEANNDAKTK